MIEAGLHQRKFLPWRSCHALVCHWENFSSVFTQAFTHHTFQKTLTTVTTHITDSVFFAECTWLCKIIMFGKCHDAEVLPCVFIYLAFPLPVLLYWICIWHLPMIGAKNISPNLITEEYWHLQWYKEGTRDWQSFFFWPITYK